MRSRVHAVPALCTRCAGNAACRGRSRAAAAAGSCRAFRAAERVAREGQPGGPAASPPVPDADPPAAAPSDLVQLAADALGLPTAAIARVVCGPTGPVVQIVNDGGSWTARPDLGKLTAFWHAARTGREVAPLVLNPTPDPVGKEPA